MGRRLAIAADHAGAALKAAIVARVAEIAAEEAPRLGLTEAIAHDYLTKNLHYHLTSAERSGLKLFCELAAQHNLVKPNVDIVFRDFATA